MPRKPTSAKSGKSSPSEDDLHEVTAFKDLLVSDEDLAKHTAHADGSVTREEVRQALSKIDGNLVNDIRQERDQG